MTQRAKPAKKGRPTILTDSLQEKIVALVLRGAYIETACGASGVPRQLMYEWLRKGQAGVEPFAKFYLAITEARDQAEFNALNCITTAAVAGDWKAAAWYLEKAQGKRYSGVQVTEAKIEQTSRIEIAERVKSVYGIGIQAEADDEPASDGESDAVPNGVAH